MWAPASQKEVYVERAYQMRKGVEYGLSETRKRVWVSSDVSEVYDPYYTTAQGLANHRIYVIQNRAIQWERPFVHFMIRGAFVRAIFNSRAERRKNCIKIKEFHCNEGGKQIKGDLDCSVGLIPRVGVWTNVCAKQIKISCNRKRPPWDTYRIIALKTWVGRSRQVDFSNSSQCSKSCFKNVSKIPKNIQTKCDPKPKSKVNIFI
jgi:hypothetical protein